MMKLVRKRGDRMTEVRRALIFFIADADDPIALADLRKGLEARGVPADRSTLYREIRYLVRSGLLREVSVVGFPKTYEPAEGHRHHLVCLGCNRIRSVDMEDRLGGEGDRIGMREGFEVVGHTLEFYGYCGTCRDNR